MGIEYNAQVFVGLPRSDFDEDQLENWLEKETLVLCPAVYDGGGDDDTLVGFCAISSPDYGAREIDLTAASKTASEHLEKFKAITGMDGKVWLTTRGD